MKLLILLVVQIAFIRKFARPPFSMVWSLFLGRVAEEFFPFGTQAISSPKPYRHLNNGQYCTVV